MPVRGRGGPGPAEEAAELQVWATDCELSGQDARGHPSEQSLGSRQLTDAPAVESPSDLLCEAIVGTGRPRPGIVRFDHDCCNYVSFSGLR